MTEVETYPECLRRADVGGHVQTRTAQTEARYRKRYEGMAKTWRRRHRVDVVTPFELATDIGYRSSGLSANALKQYHAAIRQHLRDLWDEGAITLGEVERVNAVLRQQTFMPKSAKGKAGGRTSAGRAKSIKQEPLSALVTELLLSATAIRRIAAALLEYGVDLATRPGEFLSMREDPLGRLWVRSAKYSETNAKGLQPARMLIVDTLDTFEITELKEIAALLQTERDVGAIPNSLLRRRQHAIREARSRWWARPQGHRLYRPPSGPRQYGGFVDKHRGSRCRDESCQRHDGAIALRTGPQRLEERPWYDTTCHRSPACRKSQAGQQVTRLDRAAAERTEAEIGGRGERRQEINR